MSATQAIGLGVLCVVVGLGFGYLIARLSIARRRERDGINAEELTTSARLEAQKILAKAEEEGQRQGGDLPGEGRGGPGPSPTRAREPRVTSRPA